jgi:hypothetical protein
MPRAIRVARVASYLLLVGCWLFTSPVLRAQEPQPEQPPADTASQPEAAPPDAASAAGDAATGDDTPDAEAPAEAEPTSLDELTAPLSEQDAPSWLQPYFVFLDTDQNRSLSAPELEAWRARGGDVMTVIEPSKLPVETFTGPMPSPEIVTGIADLVWQPNFVPKTRTLLEKGQRIIFRREVWCLEFSFRPLRMVELDIPAPSGKMERKQVWYMVYRVRYLGDDLKPAPSSDAIGNTTYPTTNTVAYNYRRFFPQFVFQSFEYDKRYLDQIIPAAREAIAVRERPPAKLHNSVEMMNVRIPLSEPENAGVWGYVTWTDIDPRSDFFAIFINGLTNAFQIQDEPGAFKPGDPPLTGRQFAYKTLQLNFWRAGDSVEPHEEEIRFGVPIDGDLVRQQEFLNKYGLTERLDYLWVYR